MPQDNPSPLKRVLRSARRVAADVWLNRLHPNTVQIGLTGSYGKTSTTYALHAVLSRHAPTLMTDLNLDTIYNVPITALRLRDQLYLIFELGIDTRNEMSLHLEIAQPCIGVITGIAPVHADPEHLGSLENIITEKRKLIEALPPDGLAVLNADNEHVREMAAHTPAPVVWYGTAEDADCRAERIRLTTTGTRFWAVTPSSSFQVNTPLLGRHNAANMMAAVAIAQHLDIPDTTIQAAFAQLEPLKGRMSIEEGPRGTTLLNDALRANTASTRAGLRFLHDLEVEGRRVAVLGEMGEIGETAEEEHYTIGKYLADLDINRVVCVGELTERIAQGARDAGFDAITNVSNVDEAAAALDDWLQSGDALYLKGSLLRHLERVRLILGGREVGCFVRSCPFYHQCTECPYLEEGYEPT